MYPDIQVKMDAENAKTDEKPIVDFGFYQLNQNMRNKYAIVTTIQDNAITHTCTIAEAQIFKCIFQRLWNKILKNHECNTGWSFAVRNIHQVTDPHKPNQKQIFIPHAF